MEPEQSIMSSEDEIASLRDNLNWHAAILAVLLEEAGGAVEISRTDLESINLSQAQATIMYDDERNVYVIERVKQDAV